MVSPSFTLIDVTPHYIVVSKDHNLPTVPLKNGPDSTTLLDLVSAQFPEIRTGSHEGLILHRLDTATRGLVLIARNLEVFHYFQEEQKVSRLIKTYYALTTHTTETPLGYPPVPFNLIENKITQVSSSFCPYGKGRREVRPVTEQSKPNQIKKKTSSLYCSTIFHESENENSQHLFKVTLTKGFRHQVRSHLAWTSFPLIGDTLYGGEKSSLLHLVATKIQFYDYNTHTLKEYSLFSEGYNPFEESLYKEN